MYYEFFPLSLLRKVSQWGPQLYLIERTEMLEVTENNFTCMFSILSLESCSDLNFFTSSPDSSWHIN